MSAMRSMMLRVIRNHRRAAYGETVGYEDLHMLPVALDHATLRHWATTAKRSANMRRAAWDRALVARRDATAIAMRR